MGARQVAAFSFAPWGLALDPHSTHGLRRGLHSCAASRLLLASQKVL